MKEQWYPIRDNKGRYDLAYDFAKPIPLLQSIANESMLKKWISQPEQISAATE